MGRFKPFQGLGGKRRSSVGMGDTKPDENTAESEALEGLQESRDKTAQVQEQVDEVKSIMQQNVDKAIQRGETLEELEAQTSRLQESAGQFNKNAAQVKENLRWKKMRRAIIISVVVLVILAVLCAVAVIMMKKKKGKK
jgi:vesicle-associated membrane protein 4